MIYFDELCAAMKLCARRDNAIFMGQAVACRGTTMSATFDDIPMEKRLEMPVTEDMQAGMAIGMALSGKLPICVYPRWNFMLCAGNQIVNHLDRLALYSDNQYRPRVIIRTAVPSVDPFYQGPQHDDDFTGAFKLMCRTIKIVELKRAADIVPEYEKAIDADHSTILVEYTSQYRNIRAKEAA